MVVAANVCVKLVGGSCAGGVMCGIVVEVIGVNCEWKVSVVIFVFVAACGNDGNVWLEWRCDG